MFKLLALVVVLAVAVSAYPAVDDAGVQTAPKALPADGQVDVAAKNLEVDLEGGNDGDLKGSETFGFGYYPVYGYGRGYGYGGYGGWGYGSGWGGYGRGWGWGGYPRRYYW